MVTILAAFVRTKMGAFPCFLSVFEDLLYAYRVPDVYHPGRGLNHKAIDPFSDDGGGRGVSRKSRMLNPQLKHVSYRSRETGAKTVLFQNGVN